MAHIPADVRARVAPTLAKEIARLRAEDAAAKAEADARQQGRAS